MKALRERDPELADEVIAFDDEVDARYLRSSRGVESLLARQTPVAFDLRLVLASSTSTSHLERMADLCRDHRQAHEAGLCRRGRDRSW